MIEKLKTLQTLLGSENLILTGSTALAYHGLLEFTEAKDLDLLLVNPTPDAISICEKLQSAAPNKKHPATTYSFKYEGVKVDIWVLASHEDINYCFNSDGVKIASIKTIVKAKLSYNRSKDWIQLMQLATKIFDADKFKTSLAIITNHSEEYAEEIVSKSK